MLGIFFFLFGLAIGSFLNVVILRLKDDKSILGRSCCPKCGRQLKWFHNIPVLSFIWLKAHCAFCQEPISWQYPIIEITSGFLWLLAYLKFFAVQPIHSIDMLINGGVFTVFVYGVLASILLALFVFDLRWYILPDQITLPGILLALIFNLSLGRSWQWLLLAATLGCLFFLLQYLFSRGVWVGAGDIRLGALVGAMVGSWEGLLVVLLLSYLTGSIVGVSLVLSKKIGWRGQLPFGTFLTVATIITLFWGSNLWHWYLGLVW